MSLESAGWWVWRRCDCASPSDPEPDDGDAGSSPWVQTWGGPQESTARAAAQTARSLALCLQETKGSGSQWPPGTVAPRGWGRAPFEPHR